VSDEEAAASRKRNETRRADALLNAASSDDVAAIQQLLKRGCPADACDYDKRTGLMLAAANGHQEVVSLLLSAGANPNARDNLGGSPLLEAVKGGHTAVLSQLVAAGATLQLSDSELASALCSMVLDGEQGLLRRYIAAGANVSVGDYDRRTPLHVAAAEDKLNMVSVVLTAPHSCCCSSSGCWALEEQYVKALWQSRSMIACFVPPAVEHNQPAVPGRSWVVQEVCEGRLCHCGPTECHQLVLVTSLTPGWSCGAVAARCCCLCQIRRWLVLLLSSA
jgi:hypothetical protein